MVLKDKMHREKDPPPDEAATQTTTIAGAPIIPITTTHQHNDDNDAVFLLSENEEGQGLNSTSSGIQSKIDWSCSSYHTEGIHSRGAGIRRDEGSMPTNIPQQQVTLDSSPPRLSRKPENPLLRVDSSEIVEEDEMHTCTAGGQKEVHTVIVNENSGSRSETPDLLLKEEERPKKGKLNLLQQQEEKGSSSTSSETLTKAIVSLHKDSTFTSSNIKDIDSFEDDEDDEDPRLFGDIARCGVDQSEGSVMNKSGLFMKVKIGTPFPQEVSNTVKPQVLKRKEEVHTPPGDHLSTSSSSRESEYTFKNSLRSDNSSKTFFQQPKMHDDHGFDHNGFFYPQHQCVSLQQPSFQKDSDESNFSRMSFPSDQQNRSRVMQGTSPLSHQQSRDQAYSAMNLHHDPPKVGMIDGDDSLTSPSYSRYYSQLMEQQTAAARQAQEFMKRQSRYHHEQLPEATGMQPTSRFSPLPPHIGYHVNTYQEGSHLPYEFAYTYGECSFPTDGYNRYAYGPPPSTVAPGNFVGRVGNTQGPPRFPHGFPHDMNDSVFLHDGRPQQYRMDLCVPSMHPMMSHEPSHPPFPPSSRTNHTAHKKQKFETIDRSCIQTTNNTYLTSFTHRSACAEEVLACMLNAGAITERTNEQCAFILTHLDHITSLERFDSLSGKIWK